MTEETAKLVLVVDDEEDVRNYFGALLADAGFRVARAADGDEALEMVKAEKPDLISLDLVMPGKSGARFLYALRKNREWRKIPVLIVTGHAHDDLGKKDLEEILAERSISGPQVYLEKPVRPASYVEAVQKQLGVEEKPPSPAESPSSLRDEVSRLLEDADPDTIRRIRDLLTRKD